MSDPAISLEGITRKYGDRVAVEDVSLSVAPGQVCALLGPNGAGKTTILRILLGLIAPTRGQARVGGVAVPGSASALAALRGRVGLLTETPGIYDRLSAWENLNLFGRLYGMAGATLADRIEAPLRQLGLWDRREDAVATFSKGMKQRLAIARAIFHQPGIVLLDEPTAGLDPAAAREVRGLIRELRSGGRTVILCTHNLAEAADLADLVAVLRTRLVAFGPPASLGRSTAGHRVRVTVVEPAPAAGQALEGVAGATDLRVSGGQLEFLARDPGVTPAAVAALVSAGCGVREVRSVEPTLEEIYLSVLEQA